jgi:hypothetical protein
MRSRIGDWHDLLHVEKVPRTRSPMSTYPDMLAAALSISRISGIVEFEVAVASSIGLGAPRCSSGKSNDD